jgi:hypothetical protein
MQSGAISRSLLNPRCGRGDTQPAGRARMPREQEMTLMEQQLRYLPDRFEIQDVIARYPREQDDGSRPPALAR